MSEPTLASLEDALVKALTPTNTIIDSWIAVANTLRPKRKAQLQLPPGVRRGAEGQFYAYAIQQGVLPSLVTKPRRRLPWRR